MPETLADLQRRALALAKQADFGADAAAVNAEIVARDPRQEAAWTRLGRCHLEQRAFDDAVVALRAALAINPGNSIATNLLNEVRRRRALTPTAAERASTGFGVREFAALGALAPGELAATLATRIETLFDAINASPIAATILDARRRTGESASKLFHANSFHSTGPGQLVAFHHGGRWEPQFNIGWFAHPPMPASGMRIGLGFNMAATSREAGDAAKQERVLLSFERFQRVLGASWRTELARWMSANKGFIQWADRPPATEMLPEQAVDWLLACRHAAALGWIFVGRFLFLDDAADARLLADRAKLAKAADETFRAMFPLWAAAYSDETASRD